MTAKKNEEVAKLYEEATRAWASGNRLSKNRTIHINRYVLRNRAKNGKKGK